MAVQNIFFGEMKVLKLILLPVALAFVLIGCSAKKESSSSIQQKVVHEYFVGNEMGEISIQKIDTFYLQITQHQSHTIYQYKNKREFFVIIDAPDHHVWLQNNDTIKASPDSNKAYQLSNNSRLNVDRYHQYIDTKTNIVQRWQSVCQRP